MKYDSVLMKPIKRGQEFCHIFVTTNYSASHVKLAEPMLPYALAFAAGAMIYVVVDDIVPEAQTR